MSKEYQQRREQILKFFDPEKIEGESRSYYSPSKNFSLLIEKYKIGENSWNYSRGIIKNSKSGKVIAEIKRNYSHFWHTWCQHNNGNEYLLCGEDYQGQTIVNLTKETVANYFPEEGYKGAGFCWANTYPSPDSSILAVEGCYWASNFEIVFFDFSEPDKLPYREIRRIWNTLDVKGWNENGFFVVEQDVEIRESDGTPYNELSEEEQIALDNGEGKTSCRIDTLKIDLKELLKGGERT